MKDYYEKFFFLPEVWIRKLMICRLRSLILEICGTITKNEVLLTLYWLEENGFLIRNNNIAEKRYTLTLKGELLYDRFSQIEE